MSTSAAGWYPDPETPGQQRYWDGSQWTANVAPGAAGSPGSPGSPGKKVAKRMPGWAIALIVAGGLVLVIGLLAAAAIPIWLDQQDKAKEQAARESLQRLSVTIATLNVDHDEAPLVGAMGSAVLIEYPDGTAELVQLDQGVAFGGYAARDDGEFCVWVRVDGTANEEWRFDSLAGYAPGACSAADGPTTP